MQEQYLNHVNKLGEVLDLTITSCFLSLPIVALLWSILSFTVAVAAFCVQNSDLRGEVLLAVILGVMGLCGCCILFFFWHIWQDPPHYEREGHHNPKMGWETPSYMMSLTWREKIGEWKRTTILKLKRRNVTDSKGKHAEHV
jgi:hypothetical protein